MPLAMRGRLLGGLGMTLGASFWRRYYQKERSSSMLVERTRRWKPRTIKRRHGLFGGVLFATIGSTA